MVRPNTPSTWMQGLDLPSRLFGDVGGSDYELYAEDDEFVLTIDIPGFETDEIQLAWDDGVLTVAAEHADGNRGRKKIGAEAGRFADVLEDAEGETRDG